MFYSVEGYIGNAIRNITVDAVNREDAVNQVTQKLGEGRITILRVRAAAKTLSLNSLAFWEKVSARELEFFCRQMHAMLTAGVTALEAINSIVLQTEKKKFRDALQSVVNNVREGFSLSVSFQGYPDIFPPVFCNTVAAAEEAGALEDAMKRLADHFAHESQFWGRIRQAAAYPSIVVGMAILEVIALFTYVVPKFADLLTASNTPLPLSTKFLLALSSHAQAIFPLALLMMLALIYVIRQLWKDERIRHIPELSLVKIPVLGKLVSRLAAARVCRTMALMFRVGVSVTQALSITAKVAGFVSFKQEILTAQDAVREGKSLAEAFSKSKWLPPASLKMLSVGEKSGKIDEMLEHAASLFEMEVDALTQKLPAITEAGLVMVVGGIVLFVLVAVYSPIFGVYQTIQ